MDREQKVQSQHEWMFTYCDECVKYPWGKGNFILGIFFLVSVLGAVFFICLI